MHTCLSVVAEFFAMFCSRPETKSTAVSSRCRFREPLFFFVTVLLCRHHSQASVRMHSKQLWKHASVSGLS